ncbi:uncharacterized protein LOC129574863 isoform X2 [Sitodiplosis mosellana]|uniref:uncharacterized protein LOC129574863 isoform X2 n=1 Tax=Sitodiplosis mosellana TaxID=263140 RepID=UPI0024450E88|nr:uncharacterized protein LOC129574863 isoform X2 [Sitodiplosis mosellana]
MSALLKNLHVHFDDDVLSESATKSIMDDELAGERNGVILPTPPMMLNYSREKLLEFGLSKASKEPPKMFDLSGADDKRMEKIRYVLKNNDIWKSRKNGATDGTVVLKGGVAENNATQKDQARTNFQQMISAAVSNAQQQNVEYAAATAATSAAATNHRRRIGSGRIPDQNFTAPDNAYAIGMDVRYMRNKLFKEDGKVVKNWKSGNDLHWNFSQMAKQASDFDNADAKSDEPEWANCGPISKHDIIELHGFDGPEEDDTSKSENDPTPPPQRNSTPSKSSQKKTVKDDHFNFEDFLKLDLPPSVNCSRDLGAGESRFSQWFGRDKLSHSNGKFAGNAYEGKTTQQFFDYHQKSNQKKMNAPNKLRSVNELEADWCPPQTLHQAKVKEQKPQPTQAAPQPDINAIRMMLNQLAAATVSPAQRSMNSAQSNFLLSLINKGAENLYQYRLSQNAIMERPDAQLMLHRLVNGELTQFHILQQINNPNIHQRDRDTLLAVFAFWNENQQRLVQQQKQTHLYKEQMSQQLRQLQMIQMKNGGYMQSPTPQELQIHTQNIMQNAMYKKQFEDQYRNLQNLKIGNQTKFQSYKPNNNFMSNQPYNNNRFNYKQQQQKQTQFGQNGLQFIQSQNKSLWNRQNQTNATGNFPFMNGSSSGGMRNTNDLFDATMPSFAKFDSPTMGGDKMSITVEK